ncbi:hypothetical protein PM082_015330 [Marasmius tenuissimus]|nr:hypothetical protein PM082_015330 [Marasmius tenuissimus]
MSPEELLKTLRSGNYTRISPQEASQFIHDAQYDIKLYETQIQQLRARQAAFRRDIARYRSLHAPIRKLPPEVLRRIFGFASGCSTFREWNRGWTSAAFSISSVCARWRDIALQSPELWADMCIPLREMAIEPVRLALSRSRKHPLSIRLEGGDVEDPASYDLLQLLKSTSSRWQTLDLIGMISTPELMETFGDTPLLESVVCEGTMAVSVLERYLTHVPRLREVKYSFWDFGTLEDMTFLPANTLRHLEMEHDGTSTLFAFFESVRLCTALRSLAYFGPALAEGDPYKSSDDPLECVVSKLASFSIELWNYEGFYALLSDLCRGLTLPSLTNLRICFTGTSEQEDWRMRDSTGPFFRGQWPRSILGSLFKRSGCNLTSLSLGGIPLHEKEVVEMLNHAPT